MSWRSRRSRERRAEQSKQSERGEAELIAPTTSTTASSTSVRPNPSLPSHHHCRHRAAPPARAFLTVSLLASRRSVAVAGTGVPSVRVLCCAATATLRGRRRGTTTSSIKGAHAPPPHPRESEVREKGGSCSELSSLVSLLLTSFTGAEQATRTATYKGRPLANAHRPLAAPPPTPCSFKDSSRHA